MENRRAVVYGANSSIGKETCRQLDNLGIRTVAVTRYDRSWEVQGTALVRPVEIDYNSTSDLMGVISGATEVYFTPADVSQGRARPSAIRELFPGKAFREAVGINLLLPLKVRYLAETVGVSSFNHLSTMAVYGRQSGVITEGSPLKTSGIYGITKRLAEEQLLKFQNETKVTIFRPSYVFGPGAKTWTELLYQIYSGGGKFVYGKGEGVMPIVDIRDVATSMIKAAENEQVGGQIYNLSADSFPVRKVLGCFQVLIGKEPKMTSAILSRLTGVALDARSLITGNAELVTNESINNLLDPSRVISSEKIQRELGVRFHPVYKTLMDSIIWLNEVHQLNKEEAIAKAFGLDHPITAQL